jgi:hypothetical protein
MENNIKQKGLAQAVQHLCSNHKPWVQYYYKKKKDWTSVQGKLDNQIPWHKTLKSLPLWNPILFCHCINTIKRVKVVDNLFYKEEKKDANELIF